MCVPGRRGTPRPLATLGRVPTAVPIRRLAIALAGVSLLALCIAAPAPAALTPKQLHRAYDLPTRAKARHRIAVIVAGDAPRVEQDLGVYSRRFGLPACTTRNGCFRKVNQAGKSAPLPPRDPTGGSYIAEAVLGTQVAHAICQNCRILLVAADSDHPSDLAAAVATAVRLGARAISTQYLLTDDPANRGGYDHPGVAITAATGDNGYWGGTYIPAALPGVVAVGGTRLRLRDDGRYASESVWNVPGEGKGTSGCGLFTPVPAWQTLEARSVGCKEQRSIADIAAVASPGARVYSSSRVSAGKGWLEAGGTSLASPLIAATFALAGGVPKGVTAPELLYRNFRARRGGLRDVVNGSNGTCEGAICRARKGYDGPTGIGTPKGLAAFRR